MLDKIKSLFIVEDENKNSKIKGSPKSKPTTAKNKSVANHSNISTTQSVKKGTTSSKFVNILSSALEKNNLEGFDYLEFRQSLQSLSAMKMDEKTMFQSAAAMAKTLKVTPEQLLNSAQHYIDVLIIEDQKFNEALKGQQQKKVGSKEKNIEQLEEIVKDKSAKIQQLQKEIKKDQDQATALRKEIESATLKIQQTHADFEASYQNVVGKITNDVKKIKTYLVTNK